MAMSGRDGDAVGVQEVRGPEARPEVVVQRHPDVSGSIEERLPGVVHNGLRGQALPAHFPVKFPHQRAVRRCHPGHIAVHDRLGLPGAQGSRFLAAQAAALAFFLQVDDGNIVVIIADAEFFPDIDAVQLLPQGLVGPVIKIQAADKILSVYGVGVKLHDGRQPLPQDQSVAIADLMLPFMSKVHSVHLLPGYGHPEPLRNGAGPSNTPERCLPRRAWHPYAEGPAYFCFVYHAEKVFSARCIFVDFISCFAWLPHSTAEVLSSDKNQ